MMKTIIIGHVVPAVDYTTTVGRFGRIDFAIFYQLSHPTILRGDRVREAAQILHNILRIVLEDGLQPIHRVLNVLEPIGERVVFASFVTTGSLCTFFGKKSLCSEQNVIGKCVGEQGARDTQKIAHGRKNERTGIRAHSLRRTLVCSLTGRLTGNEGRANF